MNATTHNPAAFAVVGIVAAALFAVMWIIMAEGDPTWVLGENTLSDLGISINDDVATEFKYTCMITGILLLVFGAGKAYCENGASTASGVFAAIAGVFIVLVGLYNKDYEGGDLHNTFAYLLFIFLAIAAVCSMFGDHAEGKKINAAITAALVLIVVAAVVGKDLAYVEAVAAVACIVWIAAESVKMILNVKTPAQPAACACTCACCKAEEKEEEIAAVEEAAPEEEPAEAPAEEVKE